MSTDSYLLGVDIGTQAVKGTLVQSNGSVVATASARHDVLHPRPGWMEHDAEGAWWGGFAKVVTELLSVSGISASNIVAVCVSGLFPALCPADERGRPLRNAILYADSRAAAEVDRVTAITGTTLKGDEITPKLLWLQRNDPDIFRRTRMIFSVPGYVVYRLTGRYCVDPQTAFRMGGIVDESRCGWREEVCAQLGMAAETLPPIHSSLDIIGGVTGEAASETGLPEGTSVLVGMTDTFATLLGNGVVERGEAMIYYGTTGLLTVCSRGLEEVLATPRLIDEQTPFILAAYLLDFGETLEWFIDQFLEGGRDFPRSTLDPYEVLEEGSTEVPTGCEGLLAMPHFAGRLFPQADPYARGVFFGLSTAHTRFHLWRALLESFGYEIYRSVVDLERRGISISRIVASGGGAQSKLWRQIVSDITGLPQEYVENGGAALGAALLAGYGVGLFEDLKAIREGWLRIRDVTRPRSEVRERYEKLFAVYRELDLALGKHYKALAEASTRG